MKKNLLVAFAGFITCCFFYTNSYSQAPDGILALAQQASAMEKIPVNDIDGFSFVTANLESINFKAPRNFARSGKLAENVRWYKVDDGFMVYYTEKGNSAAIKTGYDAKGNWLYTLRCYDETNLPKDIRSRVKSVYYNYSIMWVNEITVSRQVIYLVKMQDEKSYKTVRVCGDEEMSTEEEFFK